MTEIWMAVGLAVLITLVTRVKNALTWAAVITADAMLLFIICMSGLKEALFLIGMYGAVLTVDLLLGKKREQAVKDIQEKGGTRGLKQVLANGAAGCACVLFYRITENEAFLIAYYASVFEVLADSIASDVGVLSKRPPRDICTWKVVSGGISGGVSVLGLTAGGLACIVGGLAAGAVSGWTVTNIMIVIWTSYMGMLADSVIGSLLQVKHVCSICGIHTELQEHCGRPTQVSGGIRGMSNSMVNFICTVLAAIAGCLLAWIV